MEQRPSEASQAWPTQKFGKWKMEPLMLHLHPHMLPTGKKPKEEWRVTFCLIFERKLLHTSLSSFLCKGIFHKVYGKLDTPGKYWSCMGMGNLGPCWGWNCTDQLLLLQKGSTIKSDWGKKSNLIKVLGQISRGYCF